MVYMRERDGRTFDTLDDALEDHCGIYVDTGKTCKGCCMYDLRLPGGEKVCSDAYKEDLIPYEEEIMRRLGLKHFERRDGPGGIVVYGPSMPEPTKPEQEKSAHAPGVVTQETFEALVKEIRDASLETLIQRNGNYAPEADKIHNFRAGGAILGRTPAQVALGYMTKHLVSLIDKVERNDFSNRDDLLEKCQDIINYTAIIWVCGNEEAQNGL